MKMKLFALLAIIALAGGSCTGSAEAGIFGRGRGFFRGAWGSRNVMGGYGNGCRSCGPGCYPAAPKPAPNPDAEPVAPVAAPGQ